MLLLARRCMGGFCGKPTERAEESSSRRFKGAELCRACLYSLSDAGAGELPPSILPTLKGTSCVGDEARFISDFLSFAGLTSLRMGTEWKRCRR